jgi:hypothetical protein
LLACPSRRLTGASVPAAAAGQPSTSYAPRVIPVPTNRLSTSPKSQCSCRGTRWPVPPLSPPDFECPRPRHHRSAAAARRRHLRSIHRHQSITGEPNRFPRRVFATPCSTSPPASSPSPPGSREGNRGYGFEELKISRDLNAQRFYPLCVIWL